jgi:hypothetical protein
VQQINLVHVRWLPPVGRWVRLNMDGSCKVDGVVRGSEGESLGGFSKLSCL